MVSPVSIHIHLFKLGGVVKSLPTFPRYIPRQPQELRPNLVEVATSFRLMAKRYSADIERDHVCSMVLFNLMDEGRVNIHWGGQYALSLVPRSRDIGDINTWGNFRQAQEDKYIASGREEGKVMMAQS